MRTTQVKPGDVYGPLEILERMENVRSYTPTWRVRCTLCGKESVICGSTVFRAKQSIGCKHCIRDRERLLDYRAGMKVGSLTLQSPATKFARARSSWFTKCECGQIDVYKIRDLWLIQNNGVKGCRICSPIAAADVGETGEVLHFAYKDAIGLAIQRLYLNGLSSI